MLQKSDEWRRNEWCHNPLVVDLFAGAGGLSQGFRDAGYRIVQAVEMNEAASATYAANHPNVDVVSADICTLDTESCLERITLARGEVFALIGGPPCQGFSESNRRTRNLDNPRNHLYREFLRFVAYLSPQWVVLENVAGLRTMANGVILGRMLDGLRIGGYRADCLVLNAVNHGVPQVRRRLFVIANRVGAQIPSEASLSDANQTPTNHCSGSNQRSPIPSQRSVNRQPRIRYRCDMRIPTANADGDWRLGLSESRHEERRSYSPTICPHTRGRKLEGHTCTPA